MNQIAKDDRLLHTFSFSIPAKKFDVNFDITTTKTLSAFLEVAIQLLDIFEVISPKELQSFIKITDSEREELISQVVATGFAKFNEDGLLEATSNLRELKQKDGSIQLEVIENYDASFYVDLLSQKIQPKGYSIDTRGKFYSLITDKSLHKEFNASDIFQKEFNRFKYCSKDEGVKKINSRLYRINNCSYDRLTTLPICVDILSSWKQDGKLNISTKLSGFRNEDLDFVSSSGIMAPINNLLKGEPSSIDICSFHDFCQQVNDNILINYITNDGSFDIEAYLIDRESKKTGYGSKETTGILGPIFLPKNQNSFLSWLTKIPNEKNKPSVFWLPSVDKYWGASVYMTDFYYKSIDMLYKKQSSLFLTLPDPNNKVERHGFWEKYKGLNNSSVLFKNAQPLDEIEIFVMPGQPCWAMVQYHARIYSKYNLNTVRIPIGYRTYDPQRVKLIWELLLRKLNFGELSELSSMEENKILNNQVASYLAFNYEWQ